MHGPPGMRVWDLPGERVGRGAFSALAVLWIAGLRGLRSKKPAIVENNGNRPVRKGGTGK